MSNLVLISETLAAFILHEDTRLSQKAIDSFDILIREVTKLEPSLIS
jgi:hypothetical protein